MAQPVVLQTDFGLGMKRDLSRDSLTDRTAWTLRDVIPNNGAPIRKRGGMSQFASRTQTASETYSPAVAYAPFIAGNRVAWLSVSPAAASAQVLMTTLAGTITNIGTSVNYPTQPPVFYRDKLYLLDWLGTGQLLACTVSAVAISPGSPPTARFGCVYKDHLVLAATSTLPQRIWFSRGGDPTASSGNAAGGGWTGLTTDAGPWIDASFPITGMASLRNMIIVFAEGSCERVVGDVSPGVVGSDIAMQPLFQVGCAQPNSIVVHEDTVIFANQYGVYQTDGNALKDLTATGGMKAYWLSALAGYSAQTPSSPHVGWTIACGIYRNRLFISVMDAGVFKDGFMVDLENDAWVRLGGDFRATMMASAPAGARDPAELFMAVRSDALLTPRIYKGSGIWSPTSSNRTDPNSVALSPQIDTAFYRGKFGRKRFRKIHAAYDLRDASTSAVMTMIAGTDPGEDVGSLTLPTWAETTAYLRDDKEVKTEGDGIHLRITVPACDDWKLYGLGGEIIPSEESRF